MVGPALKVSARSWAGRAVRNADLVVKEVPRGAGRRRPPLPSPTRGAAARTTGAVKVAWTTAPAAVPATTPTATASFVRAPAPVRPRLTWSPLSFAWPAAPLRRLPFALGATREVAGPAVRPAAETARKEASTFRTAKPVAPVPLTPRPERERFAPLVVRPAVVPDLAPSSLACAIPSLRVAPLVRAWRFLGRLVAAGGNRNTAVSSRSRITAAPS